MIKLKQLRNRDRGIVANIVDSAINTWCGSCEHQGLTYIRMVRHRESFGWIPITQYRQKFCDMGIAITIDKWKP